MIEVMTREEMIEKLKEDLNSEKAMEILAAAGARSAYIHGEIFDVEVE